MQYETILGTTFLKILPPASSKTIKKGVKVSKMS